MWNRLEYRPLEGFVYAILHLTLLRLQYLPASAAMMGNVVIWKPSDSQVFSAQIIIEVFKEAGVLTVINVVFWRCFIGYLDTVASRDFRITLYRFYSRI
jgi:1-pyrroline-5-carboxylate dehydrogenase